MFKTQNYTIIWCDKCMERTIIEPSRGFEQLNCKCKTEPAKEENGTVELKRTRQAKKQS